MSLQCYVRGYEFAGLAEYWKSLDDEWLASAAIIATDDGPDMHEIHNRMSPPLTISPDFPMAGLGLLTDSDGPQTHP